MYKRSVFLKLLTSWLICNRMLYIDAFFLFCVFVFSVLYRIYLDSVIYFKLWGCGYWCLMRALLFCYVWVDIVVIARYVLCWANKMMMMMIMIMMVILVWCFQCGWRAAWVHVKALWKCCTMASGDECVTESMMTPPPSSARCLVSGMNNSSQFIHNLLLGMSLTIKVEIHVFCHPVAQPCGKWFTVIWHSSW